MLTIGTSISQVPTLTGDLGGLVPYYIVECFTVAFTRKFDANLA